MSRYSRDNLTLVTTHARHHPLTTVVTANRAAIPDPDRATVAPSSSSPTAHIHRAVLLSYHHRAAVTADHDLLGFARPAWSRALVTGSACDIATTPTAATAAPVLEESLPCVFPPRAHAKAPARLRRGGLSTRGTARCESSPKRLLSRTLPSSPRSAPVRLCVCAHCPPLLFSCRTKHGF
jgi:hypothetical protein